MRSHTMTARTMGWVAFLILAASTASSDWEVISPTPQYLYDPSGDQPLPPRAGVHLGDAWYESTDPDNPLFVSRRGDLNIRIWRYDETQPEGQRLRISFWDPDTWQDPFLYPSPIVTLWSFGDGEEDWTTNTVPQVVHRYDGSGAHELTWIAYDWPYPEGDDFPSTTAAPCLVSWGDATGSLYLHVVRSIRDHIVYVKPDGDDDLGGRSWAEAK